MPKRAKKDKPGTEVIELPGVTVKVRLRDARVFVSMHDEQSLALVIEGYNLRNAEIWQKARVDGPKGGRPPGETRERRLREIAESGKGREAAIQDIADADGVDVESVKRSLRKK